jgi:hypothetical protein
MTGMEEIPVDHIGARINRDQTVVALIGSLTPTQIGVSSFMTFFEHQHFAPETPQASFFEPFTVEWDGMQLLIMVFPKEDLVKADPILKRLGLMYEQGVPDSINGNQFPFTAPNAYTIQYVPGHFAYRANADEIRRALEIERDALKREFSKIKKKK